MSLINNAWVWREGWRLLLRMLLGWRDKLKIYVFSPFQNFSGNNSSVFVLLISCLCVFCPSPEMYHLCNWPNDGRSWLMIEFLIEMKKDSPIFVAELIKLYLKWINVQNWRGFGVLHLLWSVVRYTVCCLPCTNVTHIYTFVNHICTWKAAYSVPNHRP